MVDMASSAADQELRSVIAEGLHRLNRSRGGRFLSRVADEVGVARSTVSRWENLATTPSARHCDALVDAFPEFFDKSQISELLYRSIDGIGSRAPLTVGVETLSSTAATYRAVRLALDEEPDSEHDRTYRHAALHLDRLGTDPVETDPLFDSAATAETLAYRESLAARAREGWEIRMVVSTGRLERIPSLLGMATSLDGPNVEVFAYPLELPLVLAPVVVANQFVLFAHDHRRWERPGSALSVRSRSIATWANRYFSDLIADAPFRLRGPSGLQHDEIERFETRLRSGTAR